MIIARRPLKETRLSRANIPLAYQRALVEDFRESDPYLHQVGAAYTQVFNTRIRPSSDPEENGDAARGWSLYIYGPNGRGKTHLACAIAQDVQRLSNQVLFISAARLRGAWASGELHYTSDLEGDVTFRYAARNWTLLVIDDLGREWSGKTGFGQAVVDEVIRERKQNLLPTIITSNLNPDEFGARYGEAAIDLLHERTKFVPAMGDSRRGS